MEEVRILEREEAREKEKRKNEIYDLDPSFYVAQPFPILEVHDTLRNGPGPQSSDLHAKAKLNSSAIALAETGAVPLCAPECCLPLVSPLGTDSSGSEVMIWTTQGHFSYTGGG